MGFSERHTVNITTAADGTATGYTPVVRGKIDSIVYVVDGTTPFDAGVDFTVTTEDTQQTVWAELNVNASKTVAPRQATHSTAGVAALYAAAGTAVLDAIYACGERVKIAIAQGGNVKLGRFHVIVGAQ